MKEAFNTYLDKETKRQYKLICKEVGIQPSLRISEFIKRDLEYLQAAASGGLRDLPKDLAKIILGGCQKAKSKEYVSFKISIEPGLKKAFQAACKSVETSASCRIGLFLENDLKMLKGIREEMLLAYEV